MSHRCGAVVAKHRGQVGAAARKRLGSLALLILLLVSQCLAILPARAEIAPVTESETRACGFNNTPRPMDCSSYESVFSAVDAFCKEWSNMQAYLAYSTSGYSNNGLVAHDYYKINCRNSLNPPGVNAGWEGGFLRIERTAQCTGNGWQLALPTRVCTRPDTARSCRPGDAGSSTPFPILPATSEKYRNELDWSDSGPAPLSLSRVYRSVWAGDAMRPNTGLGQVWTHSHSARLKAMPASAPHAVAITLPEGQLRTFVKAVGTSVWTVSDAHRC